MCGASWCDRCDETPPTFYIADDKYCEKCYPDPNKKRSYSKQEKLDFLLTHFKLTEEALVALMPPLNTTPDYVCTKDEEHDCVQECETLGDDWDGQRGLCCKAKNTDLCEACENKSNKKIKI